ncbi:MAG: hypothetical protein LM550_15465, partial [Candidatus Contendobacter sp.]|nr:hypothetical protein [Candidatus Contendobacter sp.]
ASGSGLGGVAGSGNGCGSFWFIADSRGLDAKRAVAGLSVPRVEGTPGSGETSAVAAVRPRWVMARYYAVHAP